MADDNDLLGSYLTDHLAGSVAAIDLIQKLRDDNQGTPLAAFMTELEPEIESDQAVLRDLIERIGEPKNPVKQAGGWVLEKLSRLRFDERFTRSADLSRLLELEMLAVGIEGKLCLWRALRTLAQSRADLADLDYDHLIGTGEQQRQVVEGHRQEAAVRAFST
jgi:hypothetical protein